MQNIGLQKLNEASSMTTYRAKDKQNIQSILNKLNLQEKYFTVLVNGELAKNNTIIEKNDKILVLPKIAGGSRIC